MSSIDFMRMRSHHPHLAEVWKVLESWDGARRTGEPIVLLEMVDQLSERISPTVLLEAVDELVEAGELRRAYRVLSPQHYATDELIFIESVEVCAIKDPMPADGPCIFTGRTAIYYGGDEYFDDHKGHVLLQNQPLAVCDKTAGNLAGLGSADIFISPSTYHYDGGGCC